MRLILFLNNWGGWQIAQYLRERREEVVALLVQPESDQKFSPEIQAALNLPKDRVWTGPDLANSEVVARLRDLQPEMGISAGFGFKLKPDVIGLFPKGCINLHAAYLPWNRGWHTNVWPILDGTPAGMTIHYIDEGIDTGDLIAQRRIPITPTETGGTLHQKLNLGMVEFFKDTWPSIAAGKNSRTPQDHAKATRHRRVDLAAVDQIHLEKKYVARQLVDLLRARTYPPYPAAYFVEGPNRTYVRVVLETADGRAPEAGSSRLINLDQAYVARQFLDLISAPAGSTGAPAHFIADSQRVTIRAVFLTEQDLNPSAAPAWTKPAA